MADLNIDLLAQRLEAQEKLNNQQAKQIEALQAANSRLEGMQAAQDKAQQTGLKLVGPVAGILFGLVGTFFAYNITGRIDANTRTLSEDQVEIAQRFERKDQRIAALTARVAKAETRKVPSLSGVMVTLENIGTRMNVIERDLALDESKFDTLTADVVSLKASHAAHNAAIAEHEEELDVAELSISDLRNKMSSVEASTAAAFVEVETQIRSWIDTANLRAANTWGWLTVVGELAGVSMPDNDFYPDNIPAQATTQVGKINGN